MKSILSLFLLLCCSLGFAQDPQPTPIEPKPQPAIIAPVGVSGTGSRVDPYLFDSSTRCLLKLVGDDPVTGWDTKDCPSDLEILADKYLSFSLNEPGEYQVIVYGPNVRAWFIVSGKGPRPPPTPPEPPTPVVTAEKLWFVVIDDFANRTPQTASVLTDLNFWDGLKKGGHQWAVVPIKDDSGNVTPAAAKYSAQTEKHGTPLLVVMDASTKKILSEGKLPSKAEIEELKNKLTGVK